MPDMLPQELFQNPDTTFLDPACKTGVFLSGKLPKGLIKGLEPQFHGLTGGAYRPHFFHKQLFGILQLQDATGFYPVGAFIVRSSQTLNSRYRFLMMNKVIFGLKNCILGVTESVFVRCISKPIRS